jgi:hypothetical protein
LQNLWLQRIETVTVPTLLKQIYQAEMTYSKGRPQGDFTCDGALLPGSAGKLGWRRGDSSTTTYLNIDFYTISLDCPDESNPRSFRLTADSNEGYIPAPELSMDMNGQLIVKPAPLIREASAQRKKSL